MNKLIDKLKQELDREENTFMMKGEPDYSSWTANTRALIKAIEVLKLFSGKDGDEYVNQVLLEIEKELE